MYTNLIKLIERNNKIKTLSEEDTLKYASQIADVKNQIKHEKSKLNWNEEIFGDYIVVTLPFISLAQCENTINVLKLDGLSVMEFNCNLKKKLAIIKCEIMDNK
jgi:hypothetical protein